MGTRFLLTRESPLHPNLKERMLQATERDTVLVGRSFRDPTRVFRNSAATQALEREKQGGATHHDLAPYMGAAQWMKAMADGDLDGGSDSHRHGGRSHPRSADLRSSSSGASLPRPARSSPKDCHMRSVPESPQPQRAAGSRPASASARALLRERWRSEGWYREETIAQALDRVARKSPLTPFWFHTEQGLRQSTTAEIVAAGQRLGGGIRGASVLVLEMWSHFNCRPDSRRPILYVAALHAGATLLPIVHIYGPEETGFILRTARARALVIPDRWRNIDYLERLSALGATPDLEHVIVVGERAHTGCPIVLGVRAARDDDAACCRVSLRTMSRSCCSHRARLANRKAYSSRTTRSCASGPFPSFSSMGRS